MGIPSSSRRSPLALSAKGSCLHGQTDARDLAEVRYLDVLGAGQHRGHEPCRDRRRA
jgi:hypothetical protein